MRLIAILFFVFIGVHAHAQEDSKSSFAVTKYEAYLSSGFLGLGKSSSQYDIAPGFQYQFLASWLQVGGEITYQKISYRGTSTSNLLFLAGPTANYESFLFSLGLLLKSGGGDVTDTSSDEPNGFGFYFLVGKHFPVSAGWSFRPSVGFTDAGTVGLMIRPFALSYSF